MNHLLFVRATIDLLISRPLLLSFAIWQASGWLVQAVYRYDVYIDTEVLDKKGRHGLYERHAQIGFLASREVLIPNRDARVIPEN
jgi:hypothetical protein